MGKLGLGFMLSLTDQRMDFSKLKPVDDDPLITQLADESSMLFDLAFGAYYQVPNSFYVGLSATRLLETTSQALSETESAQLKFQHKRHYYLTAGYQYAIPGNSAFVIDPSVLIKSDLAATQIDISAMVTYNDKFWGGMSYRFQDAVVVIVGMEYKNFYIGYSYDVTTSNIGGSSSGSHEVMAGYCFKLEVEKLRESYKNTRFL
jgi:type IX secretion system PorP/SprF family membrane protein